MNGIVQGQALVVTPPAPLPISSDRPSIFLAGSIDQGGAPDWQAEIIAMLADLPVTIFNPRRKLWDERWCAEADDPEFRHQVEWELNGLDRADIIAFYLAPGSLAPISLLEMGLYASSGRLILCCPDGFWRKGNIDIVAERYAIHRAPNIEALGHELRKKFSLDSLS